MQIIPLPFAEDRYNNAKHQVLKVIARKQTMPLSSQKDAAVDLSVVLPVYNEAENIRPLADEITAAVPSSWRHEIIAVDDASDDGSGDVLKTMAAESAALRVLTHKKNLGQSAAIATGLSHAKGAYVMTLDADRQNDPSDIPLFLKALDSGADCVCGIRAKRRDSALKRFSSRVANRFRRWLLKDTIHDAGCGFRAMRRDCLGDLPVFNGLHRFLPIILHRQGCKVTEITIKHRPRTAGVSKYGMHNRLWRGLLDCAGVWWFCRRAVPVNRVVQQAEAEAMGGASDATSAEDRTSVSQRNPDHMVSSQT